MSGMKFSAYQLMGKKCMLSREMGSRTEKEKKGNFVQSFLCFHRLRIKKEEKKSFLTLDFDRLDLRPTVKAAK